MAYINAKRLHQCAMQFNDERLDSATLFPFFNREGHIQHFLLVDLARETAKVFPFEPGLVRLPWFKKQLTIAASLANMQHLGTDEADPLGELWHFDPWWLLDAPAFKDQPTTPLLKSTNCIDLLKVENPGLGFRRDFSKVTWLLKGKGDEHTAKAWKPKFLPEQHEQDPANQSQTGRTLWVLDPIWQRK